MIESIRLMYKHKDRDKIPSGTLRRDEGSNKFKGHSNAVKDEAFRLLDEGYKPIDAAKAVGCSVSSIYLWLKNR